MIKKVTSKKQRQTIMKVAVLLLLALYFGGSSHLEFLRSFVYDHHVVVVHSEEQEKDPCHRLIYHDDTEQGCGHDSHLIGSDECQMCDLVYQGDQTLLSNNEFESENFSNKFFVLYKENIYSYRDAIRSSRAPPVLIQLS